MTRRRGRPPKSDDPDTRDRLLDAAAAACGEVGFDAVTVADVATRAGVTPAAVYNHFADKDELLYTAGRLAIDRLGASIVPAGDAARGAHEVAAAFLHPSFRESRRLVLELHLAGAHHAELAERLGEWHREFALLMVQQVAADAPTAERVDDDPTATVATFFLLLLGLCHREDLAALDAPTASLRTRVDRLVDALFGP